MSWMKTDLMNRIILFVSALAMLALTNFQCRKDNDLVGCFKGRLEIKGICMNYTIKVLEGNMDTSMVQAVWTDPSTSQTHTNVFGLASPCNFPSNLNEGDEFYFKIDKSPNNNCAVCMAYYPTPEKKLGIHVTDSPCN